jgi:hypothetical protein
MAAVKKMSVTLLFGLMGALCMILFVLGTYWAGPVVFASWTSYLGAAIVVLLSSTAAVIEKRSKGGELEFRAALKVSFGVLTLAVLSQTFFTWLLMNFIDPHFKQQLVPVLLANAESAYRRFGSTEEQLRLVMDDIRAQAQWSLGRMISGMGFQFIICFLIALLIAATVKTKKSGPTKKGS